LSGYYGGKLAGMVDIPVVVNNHSIEQIEDLHMMIEHMVTASVRQAVHQSVHQVTHQAIKLALRNDIEWRCSHSPRDCLTPAPGLHDRRHLA
jgi:hypothetical protein